MDARVTDRPALASPRRKVGFALRAAFAAIGAWAVAAAGAPAARALESTYPIASELTAWLAVAALYLVLLAATTAAFALWLAPGWLASRIVRPDDDVAVRALRASVLSLALTPLLHALVLTVIGPDAEGPRYRLASGVALVACVAALSFTELRRERVDRRLTPRWRSLAAPIAFAAFLLAVLLPRIVWQDFNPDGLELYTMGRTLASHVIARLPTGELPGENLGMLTVAYPIDWLQQTIGLREASARLPVLLYLVGAYLGVVALAERAAPRRLTVFEHVLVMAGVAGFGLALAWNSSYDPYSTDMASPASIDLLAMVLLLATTYFLFAGERAWCVASAAAMSLTRPSALLLCGLLALAVLLVERWRAVPTLVTAAFATLACIAVSLLYTHVLGPLLHAPIGESGGQLIGRLRYLRIDDWSRLAWLVVPSGIVPVLAFARWRRHDAQSRALLLVTLGYFGFFYMLAFVALHHFAPAMLLPLAVFWHTRAREETTSGRQGAVIAAGALLAVAAAWPRSTAPYRDVRRLASELRYDVGAYQGHYAQMRKAFDSKGLLDTLFAPYWAVEDPGRERVGAPWALVHYASTMPSAATLPNYVVQGVAEPPPAGMRRVAATDSAALFVRDLERWRRERAAPPPPDPRSRLYDVPRPTLFAQWGLKRGVPQVDLRKLLTGSSKPPER